MPKLVPVAINVNPNTRDMTYIPSVLHASRGDTIKWTSQDGYFTLVFPDRTPFSRGQTEICGEKKKDRSGKTVYQGQAKVARNARGASYRYQVALAVENKGVFIDPGCGEIIIR